MDIRRFGPGHRRPDGPPGTRGVTGAVIHQDARGVIAELAFERHAVIAPHTNPDTTFFVVIAGGGFVQVGGEGARINQGEAVVWPAGVAHGAYTDGTEMRAIVIELSGADDAWARGVVDALAAGSSDSPVSAAEGSLARPDPGRDVHDRSQGEPW
jgi:quercetin dioxygenase-like cupin family protein